MIGKRNHILAVMLIIFASAMVVFSVKLYCYYSDYKKDRMQYQELRENVLVEKEAKQVKTKSGGEKEENNQHKKIEEKRISQTEEDLTEQTADGAPFAVDWKTLKQLNTDIIGWVYFPGLEQISYPVLQAEDNSYYVNRTFDCSDENSKAGSIFMDYRMKADFSSPYTIIYGHNMRDGSMFSDLAKLRIQEVYDLNPYFWILTPDNAYQYQIFSVFECDRSADVFQNTFEFWDEAFFNWENELAVRSIIVPAEENDVLQEERIIVFSTCVPNSFNRTIVCGKYVTE